MGNFLFIIGLFFRFNIQVNPTTNAIPNSRGTLIRMSRKYSDANVTSRGRRTPERNRNPLPAGLPAAALHVQECVFRAVLPVLQTRAILQGRNGTHSCRQHARHCRPRYHHGIRCLQVLQDQEGAVQHHGVNRIVLDSGKTC